MLNSAKNAVLSPLGGKMGGKKRKKENSWGRDTLLFKKNTDQVYIHTYMGLGWSLTCLLTCFPPKKYIG